jgi:hypothetical protein
MRRLDTRFVLAISASPRGFAFVLFQGKDRPFDWGVKEIRGSEKNARCLAAIKKLMDTYRPETIVIEETGTTEFRRGPRIRALYRSIVGFARTRKTPVVRCTRSAVRATLGADGARKKYAIARSVAARIPAFAPHLSPIRKPWMSEDPRQSLFDAAALGITYLASDGVHISKSKVRPRIANPVRFAEPQSSVSSLGVIRRISIEARAKTSPSVIGNLLA